MWLQFNGTIDQVNISFFPGAAGAFVGLSMPESAHRAPALAGVGLADTEHAAACA